MAALLSLAATLVFGCPRPEARVKNARDRLIVRIAEYHDALSWRDFDLAVKFIAPESRIEFKALTKQMERGYTLDSWVLRDLTTAESGDRAEAVVLRSFIMPPSVTLQSESVLLAWVLIEKEWYLAGPPF